MEQRHSVTAIVPSSVMRMPLRIHWTES
jgi:hypothetical protein